MKIFAEKNKNKIPDKTKQHESIQGKGVNNVQNLSLKHNMPESCIRRPSGLTDDEWDWLIEKATTNLFENKESCFMLEMVKLLLSEKDNKPFMSILKSIGIDTKKDLMCQNWGHSAFRFFRHLCPEDYRNAINHSGLKFAMLEFYQNLTFEWISVNEITVAMENYLFDVVNAKIGDTLTIVARGFNDIETITIQNGNESFLYYEKGVSTGFGDMMYVLKQAIIQNKKEALRNTIPKAKR
jgi:hypothetical protein